MSILWHLTILITIVELCDSKSVVLTGVRKKDWWETASFYQIYPRSFKDSNGDGIGDLNGIIEKLDYLKELGITAIWLSPIFKSPMADFGYDISNYCEIQAEYGTLDDLDRLVEKAKTLGIKIILDFVPNHTSDEHEWFIKSENKIPGFEDFYIWHPGYRDPKNASRRRPPNNWLSVFRKSAWAWSEKRKEFYYHQFVKKQPDLNYRNPKVVKEMKNVMNFWLDRGVAGFRIDAVPHLFEVKPSANNEIPNEPITENTDDKDDWLHLFHVHTYDLPETTDMVYQWRKLLDDYQRTYGGETRIMMTEAWSPLTVLRQYYGNSTHDGSHIPFNFQMIERLKNTSNAHDFVACIDDWMKSLPKHCAANWVIGNHDRNRVGSRFGRDRVDAINMIILTLPGISITYYGEELGMTDHWLSWEDTIDPFACNSNPQIYEKFSRDPARTPFQWSDEKNAGFSTADKTWLPIAANYKQINVKKEETDEKSHLKVYKSLQKLRRDETIKYGFASYGAASDQVIVIFRYLNEKKMYITLANIGASVEHIQLNQFASSIPENLRYFIVSVSSTHEINEIVPRNDITLQPYESFVLYAESESPNEIYLVFLLGIFCFILYKIAQKYRSKLQTHIKHNLVKNC